jgi:hypothetical protein
MSTAKHLLMSYPSGTSTRQALSCERGDDDLADERLRRDCAAADERENEDPERWDGQS